MKLSIIVPIYNVEKYIDKCLDSIVSQTFLDYEVILVNDGSSDSSLQIAEGYRKKYPNLIKIYSKVNGGLSDARNYGINFANGEFLAFIDSDDFLDKTMFEKMFYVQEKYNSDIVACDMYYVYEDGTSVVSSAGEFLVENPKENLEILDINNSACNKIFRKKLFDTIKFPIGKWYEDLATIPQVIYESNSISHLNEPLYYYLQRSGSIAHTKNIKMFDIYWAIDSVRNYFVNIERVLPIIHKMYIKHGLFLTTLRIKNITNFKDRRDYYKLNIDTLNKYYPKWFKDPYIKSYPFKTRIIFKLLQLRLYSLVSYIFKEKKHD